MMGDEMFMPFIDFFFGDRRAERSEEVLDRLFSSREALRSRLAGLVLSFFDGDDAADRRDRIEAAVEGPRWWAAVGGRGS
jgi:hypothetical protein